MKKIALIAFMMMLRLRLQSAGNLQRTAGIDRRQLTGSPIHTALSGIDYNTSRCSL
ncbi:hypothetical protein [Rhodanobacter sp. FW021-MT20]|uniref:hypothetical protein n=1 Tax=Rhodanobacter sp. FW021-MT20 TaxID=1162282 RepID=UPI0034E5B65C